MVQLYEKGDPPLSLNEAFTQSAATKADIAELRAAASGSEARR